MVTAMCEHQHVIYVGTENGRAFAVSWTTGSFPLSDTSPIRHGYRVPDRPQIIELGYPLGGTAYPVLPAVQMHYGGLTPDKHNDLWAILHKYDNPGKDQQSTKVFAMRSIHWEDMTLNLADANGFGPRLQSIYYEETDDRIYLAGGSAVYRLDTDQREWFDITNNLPTACLPSDLKGVTVGGQRALLLSTFNRSVWRTDLLQI
jgi:hypothetical protein